MKQPTEVEGPLKDPFLTIPIGYPSGVLVQVTEPVLESKKHDQVSQSLSLSLHFRMTNSYTSICPSLDLPDQTSHGLIDCDRLIDVHPSLASSTTGTPASCAMGEQDRDGQSDEGRQAATGWAATRRDELGHVRDRSSSHVPSVTTWTSGSPELGGSVFGVRSWGRGNGRMR